jgi:hypothetical protein
MEKSVVIDYTNWRGERRNHRIQPTGRMVFTKSEWHKTPCWLMEARDLDTDDVRFYAIKDMHSWVEAT